MLNAEHGGRRQSGGYAAVSGSLNIFDNVSNK